MFIDFENFIRSMKIKEKRFLPSSSVVQKIGGLKTPSPAPV